MTAAALVASLSVGGLLARPSLYHYLRQIMTGGMPFRSWVQVYGLADASQRVADIGCGPADILRFLRQSRPAFYLGVDVSERYLAAARQRAARAGVPSALVAMDLSQMSTDPAICDALVGLLNEHAITRVLLLGVLHHIDDAAAVRTLDVLARGRDVRHLVTIDVVQLPDRRIPSRLNNFLAGRDRGRFVRDEAGYDALMARSAWPRSRKFWTSPNFSFIKYLHYELAKD